MPRSSDLRSAGSERDDPVTRVRDILERSRQSLRGGTTRQVLEDSTRQLLERSRSTVAQFVGTPQDGSQEVLAGVCSGIALRDLNLLDALLEQLERMEADEDDPEALEQLYKLDHLATRLRRNSENLRVLAGRDAGHGKDESASLVDVIRAGMSSVEQYTRIELGKVASLGVVGLAADDVSRLLAEILDNATSHSPPSAPVTVSAHLTEQSSILVRIEDSGIGLPEARLSVLNDRLASAPALNRNTVQHMGLAVVHRLASRHGIRVQLARRAPQGTVASVLLPPGLLREVGHTPTRSRHNDPATSPSSSGSSSARPASPPRHRPQPPKDPTGSVEPTTTSNGLPRRVPQSLKDSMVVWPDQATGELDEQDKQDNHNDLLADLDEFAAGEAAARAHQEPHAEGQDK